MKDILSLPTSQVENKCLKCGYMWRQTINKQYTSSWMLRFFRLKEDYCLYSYRNEFVSSIFGLDRKTWFLSSIFTHWLTFQETIPLGAINVTKYTVQKLINFTRSNTFLITKKEGKTIYFSLESIEDFDSWISLLSFNTKHQVLDTYQSEEQKFINSSTAVHFPCRVKNEWNRKIR